MLKIQIFTLRVLKKLRLKAGIIIVRLVVIRKLHDGWGKLWNLIICYIVVDLNCFNTQGVLLHIRLCVSLSWDF